MIEQYGLMYIHQLFYVAGLKFRQKVELSLLLHARDFLRKIMIGRQKLNLWYTKYLKLGILLTGVSANSQHIPISTELTSIELDSNRGIRNYGMGSIYQPIARENALIQLVYHYPEKTTWFLHYMLRIGAISFMTLGTLTIAFLVIYQSQCIKTSKYLSIWLLIHAILQIIQAICRIYYIKVLGKQPIGPNTRITYILQSIKKLTDSEAWKRGKILSVIYYIWFTIGFYWILNVSNSQTQVNEIYESDSLIISWLHRRTYSLLSDSVQRIFANLSSVDIKSTIWPFYLLIMLFCTLRIILLLATFYLTFPLSTSHLEYPGNKTKSFTLDKLMMLPVKTYSEWIYEKEQEEILNKKTNDRNIQDSCIICLTDFSCSDLIRCLPCNHSFHESCIDVWLLRSAVCPLCQQTLE
ncbi:zinc finger, C3HC4 type domain-containing protein [Cryptosporidium muris RN66]|uniref:Zinc finger, C3HC4 type domain-containing protein n=1 Tax=Cryptosporidium muris (strain RN66) TaxID=441375 RepID=B6AHJ8_CRYMR|nr:zinc finger, C3HC4 type domain-containing protein [Cryptosporidium muris RN66]EEA07693.1 zinc finger, C3HC4 type domain-containing protein [Cryptosporidium muris RN66]|eukprot:XP_002142042.1 zinc finger, C3HC4 type domain-containing protein [Cryptosporidium muris RN66]